MISTACGYVPLKRIKRNIDHIQNEKNITQFKYTSFEKFPYLISEVKNKGGNGVIEFLENTLKIKYVAMLPEYATCYLGSISDFRLYMGDGTFMLPPYGGAIIIFVAITGNHNALPISWGWGPSESEEIITIVISLMKKFINDFKCTISVDESKAFSSSIMNNLKNAVIQFFSFHIFSKFPKEIQNSLYEIQNTGNLQIGKVKF